MVSLNKHQQQARGQVGDSSGDDDAYRDNGSDLSYDEMADFAKQHDEDGSSSEYDPDQQNNSISEAAIARESSSATLPALKKTRQPPPARLDLTGQKMAPSSSQSPGSARLSSPASPPVWKTNGRDRPSKSNSTLSINVNAINASNGVANGLKGSEAANKRRSTKSAKQNTRAASASRSRPPDGSKIPSAQNAPFMTNSSSFTDDSEFLPGQWSAQNSAPAGKRGDYRGNSLALQHNGLDDDDEDDENNLNLSRLAAWSFPPEQVNATASAFSKTAAGASSVPFSARKLQWKEAVQLAQEQEKNAQEAQHGNTSSSSLPPQKLSTVLLNGRQDSRESLFLGLLSSQATAEVRTSFQLKPFDSIEEYEAAKRELKRLQDRLIDKRARLRTLRRLRGAAGKLAKSELRRDQVAASPYSAPGASTSMTGLPSPLSPIDVLPSSASNLSVHSNSSRSKGPASMGVLPLPHASFHSRTSSVATTSDFGGASASGIGTVESASEQVDRVVEEIFDLEGRVHALRLRMHEHVARVLLSRVELLESRKFTPAGSMRPAETTTTDDSDESGDAEEIDAEEEEEGGEGRQLSDLDEVTAKPRKVTAKSENVEVQEMHEKLREALSSQADIRNQHDRVVASLHVQKQELDSSKSLLDESRRANAAAESKVKELQAQLAESQRNISEQQSRLTTLQRSAADSQKAMAEAGMLEKQVATLQGELTRAQAALSDTTGDRDRLVSSQALLRKDVEAAQDQIDILKKESSSSSAAAASASAKYEELELAVSAERKIMAERDTLFHAFEARLERAETTLREQDRRCAALLGKSEGREELDDFLAKIRGGAKKEKKTAGQDIDELLRSLGEHVEDLADELVRRGRAGHLESGDTSYNDLEEDHDNFAAGDEMDFMGRKQLISQRNSSAATAAATARVDELEDLLEQSRDEVVRLRGQVEDGRLQLEALQTNLAKPSGTSRVVSAQLDKEKVNALESQLAVLSKENAELRAAAGAPSSGSKGKVGSGNSTVLSDSSLVKVAGSHASTETSSSDESEYDDSYERRDRNRKVRQGGTALTADYSAPAILNAIVAMLPRESQLSAKPRSLYKQGDDSDSLGGDVTTTTPVRKAPSRSVSALAARFESRDLTPSPTSLSSPQKDLEGILGQVRVHLEAAKCTAEKLAQAEEETRKLRGRNAQLEDELASSQRQQSAWTDTQYRGAQGDPHGPPLTGDAADEALLKPNATGSVRTRSPTHFTMSDNSTKLPSTSTKVRSISRLCPLNASTPSFLLSQPMSADRERTHDGGSDAEGLLPSPTSYKHSLSTDSESSASTNKLLRDGSSQLRAPPKGSARMAVPRRSVSATEHRATSRSIPFPSVSSAGERQRIPPNSADASQGRANGPVMQRSITLGLSTEQLASRIRQLESELHSATTARRSALEQVAMLEEQVKDVERQTDERMRAQRADAEASARMLEQMNNMNEGLTTASGGLNADKSLPAAPAATPSPRTFTLALPFVGGGGSGGGGSVGGSSTSNSSSSPSKRK